MKQQQNELDPTRCHVCEEQGTCKNHQTHQPKESKPFMQCPTFDFIGSSDKLSLGYNPAFAIMGYSPKTYYRYHLVNGRVQSFQEYEFASYLTYPSSLEWSRNRFVTEPAARSAAEDYCGSQARALEKMARVHREWSAKNEPRPPKFAIDDRVRYRGASPNMQGKIGTVIAIRKSPVSRYIYQAEWPKGSQFASWDWVEEASLEKLPSYRGFLKDEK